MNDIHDPLATLAPRERVHYHNGQLLGAEDFRDEQDYHRSRLAQALLYAHGPGTLAGTRVDYEGPLDPGENPGFPDGREERLRVLPGLVIDRIGRLIEIPRAACLRLAHWYAEQEPGDLHNALTLGGGDRIVADVFVSFHNCGRGRTPSFQDEPGNALDKVSYARVRDAYEVQAVLRDAVVPDPPVDPWQGLADEVDPVLRLQALQDLVFGAWQSGDAHWPDGRPPHGNEHTLDQDPTSVYLARVALHAAPAPGGLAEAPTRTVGGDGKPVVDAPDNRGRRFVYPAGSLRHLLAP